MIHFLGLPQLRLFICLYPDFWNWFSIEKLREFGLVFFIEVVVSSINLILGFESPKSEIYSSSYGPFPRIATSLVVYPVCGRFKKGLFGVEWD